MHQMAYKVMLLGGPPSQLLWPPSPLEPSHSTGIPFTTKPSMGLVQPIFRSSLQAQPSSTLKISLALRR